MTAIVVTPVRRTRPLWHRLVTALVVVQGGLLWLGGAAMFSLYVSRWKDVYERFEIRNGLPVPTKLMLELSAMLSADWTVTCAYLAAVVACLALPIALWPSRRWAFRCAGWLTVTCFLAWYAMWIFMIPTCLLPLAPCH